METQIIIVAGGSGQRMGADTPKQFLLLNEKPILMHTIEKFLPFSKNIFLVLAKNDIQTWKKLSQQYQFDTKLTIVEGGEERFFSVQNAINKCSNKGIILIHDGVRPLVSEKTIRNVIETSQTKGSAIPIIDIQESIRLIAREESMSVDRNKYKLVQTPQAFKADLLKESYQQEFNPKFTDDASVFENAGFSIFLTKGNKENIKITTHEDLQFSKYILQ